MKMLAGAVLATAVVLFLAIPPSLASTPGDPVVHVATGRIRGAVDDGLDVFKGIPFAAPPVGPLRWRPPQAVKPWAGVRPATHFGHDCMQEHLPGSASLYATVPSEDCLYLNVWAPSEHSGKLPVIVWIYGGGFVNGGTSLGAFDGAAFARHGLVFVSFNYRLGRFGFFAFPALTREDELVGNYAFMDQIAALRWVQRNIATFGGDPQNVTIFGESAGGMSVKALLASPLAQGLFARAIVQSGTRRNPIYDYPPLGRPGPDGAPSAEQRAIAFARSMGIEGDGMAALTALRKLPAEKIAAGLDMSTLNERMAFSGPLVDGKLLTQAPEQIFAQGAQIKVPVIIGATSNDRGFSKADTLAELFAPFGARQAAARALFNPDDSHDVAVVGHRIGRVRLMLEPARRVARQVAATGRPAWEYRYSYVQTDMRRKFHGAPHYSEVPFVFETLHRVSAPDFSKHPSAADMAMSQTMHAYWTNFARTGNPNGPGLPYWPAMTPNGDQLMNFTPQGARAGTDPVKAQLDLVESLHQ